MTLEHIVRFFKGHDCIRFECIFGSERCLPGSGGSHGVHGLKIWFISKGAEGAVQFVLYTGWVPKFSEKDDTRFLNVKWDEISPVPFDLGFHSKKPTYEGEIPADMACEYCDGEPCYYGGSSINANAAMYALVNGGDKALWAFLDKYYDCVFNAGEYPEPAEYQKPRRK
jgi:hypothetical protein